ncbi:phosphopantetheinyl transferase [Cryptosporidium canis]|uniref:holo-[acyl-carrier-protein] synthase n=1 Tax=Cryptosporidium canis TaxID=195482 RepID=A0ABQ8P5H0_9CRYT|nr:phosphopantetheinyl transferase [Cryptosporidium canis]
MQSRLDLRRCIDLNDACVLWCTIAELDGPGFERLINDLRLGVLGEEEFERVLRRRSLLSVLLVKFALMSYYGISPIEVKIVREGGLKPFFKFSTEEIRQIHFNVSHDEEVVIVILSKYEVGIDIMKSELPLRSRRPESSVEESTERFLNNMRSTFQPSEWEYIQRDISRFMHYWTIKESFVKYTGMGLYIDPKRLLIISNRTAGDCSSSDPNLTSLEKTRICMDNEVQAWLSGPDET